MENNNKQRLQKISDKLLSTLKTYQEYMIIDGEFDLSKKSEFLNFGIRLGEASAGFSNVYKLLEEFIQEEYCKMQEPPSKNK